MHLKKAKIITNNGRNANQNPNPNNISKQNEGLSTKIPFQNHERKPTQNEINLSNT